MKLYILKQDRYIIGIFLEEEDAIQAKILFEQDSSYNSYIKEEIVETLKEWKERYGCI